MPYKDKEDRRKYDEQYYIKHRKERLKYAREHRKEMNKNQARYRGRRTQYLRNYKLNRGCAICGYKKCAEALVFHHPNDDKDFGLGHAIMMNISLKRIEKEIEKCEILCRNCHAELHAISGEVD